MNKAQLPVFAELSFGTDNQGSTALPVGSKFSGTANPRRLRLLAALMRRPLPRKQLDRVAGSSNGPDLVAELRRRGLDLPCHRVPALDRDNRLAHIGVYALTPIDVRLMNKTLKKRGGQG